MDNKRLFEYVVFALKQVYKNDSHLICYPGVHEKKQLYHVGERSVVFRFAHYLQNLLDKDDYFKEFNLDVEYNRNNDKPKWLYINKRSNVSPDIILHKRKSNDENLLVIEFKGWWCEANKSIERDRKKIGYFTKNQDEYHFNIGLFIELGKTEDNCLIEEYGNGRLITIVQGL